MTINQTDVRAGKLERIWKKTHRDYRGTLDNGTRSVLVLRDGATCLVPLDNLTDDEIARKL